MSPFWAVACATTVLLMTSLCGNGQQLPSGSKSSLDLGLAAPPPQIYDITHSATHPIFGNIFVDDELTVDCQTKQYSLLHEKWYSRDDPKKPLLITFTPPGGAYPRAVGASEPIAKGAEDAISGLYEKVCLKGGTGLKLSIENGDSAPLVLPLPGKQR